MAASGRGGERNAERGPRRGQASAEEPGADSFPALREALKMAGGNSERVAQAPRSPSFGSPRGGPRAVHSALVQTPPRLAIGRARRELRAGAGPPRTGHVSRAAAARARPRRRAGARDPVRGAPRLAPQLPPLSGQARPVSQAMSTAASRGRSGPKSAAAPLACGKCHQMAG